MFKKPAKIKLSERDSEECQWKYTEVVLPEARIWQVSQGKM